MWMPFVEQRRFVCLYFNKQFTTNQQTIAVERKLISRDETSSLYALSK
jgi:hypothetical protein